MVKSPFKFLDSYTISDREIFFGRDQEIADLHRKVFESKILLVYGVSGTGKSSLINCGLASRFEDSDWLPINVRRGINITESLEDSINKQAISSLKKGLTITEKLQSVYLDHFKPVYLVFDQFEELFIFGSPDERREFVKLVNSILKSGIQCRIIFIIREEFLAGITEFEEDIPEIFSNRYRVEKMKRANAIIAVEGPCRVYNIPTEEGFSEELIDILCPIGNEIELTFLQIYLDRILRLSVSGQNEDQELILSKEILTRAGSVSDLLGQFLEEKVMEMENPDTGMAILKSFVSVQGTRKQMREIEILDAIAAFGIVISSPELLKFLSKFVDLRILRERDEAGHFELRHDALAAKIYEKFTAIEKDIIDVKQFIENAFSAFERRGKLLTEDDLKYINPYEDKLFLNKKLKQFLTDSRNYLLKTRKRRRAVMAATVIIIFIILTFFTGWALLERKKAVEMSDLADDKRIEALNSRDNAVRAQEEANKSRNDAIIAKDEAVLQKSVADSALGEAEKHRRMSEQQRERAEVLYIDANRQRQLAQESQKEAEKYAMEVLATNKRALYQLYLFNAKEFANRSLLMQKNDTIKALLALCAYDLVNYGFVNYSSGSDSLRYEMSILEALQKAYSKFESDIMIPGEIRAMDSKNGDIVLSDTLGRLVIARLEERADDKLPELRTSESVLLPGNTFIRTLTIESDFDNIACGTVDGDIYLLSNFRQNRDLKKISILDSRILALHFIPGKNSLVIASLDNKIRILDISREEIISEIQVKNPVKDLVLYNNKIIYSDETGGIFIWDISSPGNEPVLLYQNNKPVNALAVNLLHNWLAAASGNDIVLFPSVSDIDLQVVPAVFSVRHTGIVSSLKFSPDNQWLASAGFDGSVLVWSINEIINNGVENALPVIIENKNLKILSMNYDDRSNYLIYADNENLHLFPVSLEPLYRKLKAKMGKRNLNRNEWDYYRRGDIQYEAVSSN